MCTMSQCEGQGDEEEGNVNGERECKRRRDDTL